MGQGEIKLLGGLFLLIVVLAFILLVVSPTGLFGLNQSQKEKPVLKIGVVLPLTGVNAVYGEGAKEGLELAKNEINSSTNFPYYIEYIYEDTASDVKNAVSAAQKLISIDRVPAIIGVLSNHSLAIAPIAQENKVVFFTVASQTNKLNTAGEFVFKSDDDLGKIGLALADLAFSKGKRRAAILYSLSNDAIVEAQGVFVKRFESLGGKVVDAEGVGKDEKGYHSQLAMIQASSPDIIILGLLQNENVLALNQLKERAINAEKLSIGTVEDDVVVKGAPSSEGLVFITFQAIPSDSFLEKTNSAYVHYPKRWSMEAYDVAKIIAQSASTIGPKALSSVTLQKQLSRLKIYDGEMGQVTFDENGNAQRPIYIKQIVNGRFVPYEAS